MVGVAGYLVDGKAAQIAANPAPVIDVMSTLTIDFTAPMKEETVAPMVGGQPVNAANLKWADDAKSVAVTGPFTPFTTVQLDVGGKPVTQKGDVASDLPSFSATIRGLEPSNASSNIPPGFQTLPALLVVIDNAGLARPQAGLQQADMVFEYISEYSISRFTLVYFNQPASTMGPVRSCRMINAFLLEELHGIQMCSGGSVGTLHYLYGQPLLNTMINDFDNGNHFFRVNFKEAPHNLYTDGGRALRLRTEQPIGGGNYTVDTAHPDNGLGDGGGDNPSVPLQGITYQYDGGCTCYRPFDQGTPRVDTNFGGAQIGVKNVVIMTVQFRDAGWVEDENGGAHSIWYFMNGSGAADIYSDGKVIHGQWHQGHADQDYDQNTTQPVYFTDNNGNVIRLNSGLTWVHVVGLGQNS